MRLINIPAFILVLLVVFCLYSCESKDIDVKHVFEIKEIVLTAHNQYENPYVKVECWVDLKGPDFNKRIYGFWDGGQVFKVRIVAIKPGEWTWESGSSVFDEGLNQQKGSFHAIEWTEQEKEANSNRRGFIRPTADGHALEYADGFPRMMKVENDIGIRASWEKFGANTAKDMHDELGNHPFAIKDDGPMADFDHLNPAYFQLKRGRYK